MDAVSGRFFIVEAVGEVVGEGGWASRWASNYQDCKWHLCHGAGVHPKTLCKNSQQAWGLEGSRSWRLVGESTTEMGKFGKG